MLTKFITQKTTAPSITIRSLGSPRNSKSTPLFYSIGKSYYYNNDAHPTHQLNVAIVGTGPSGCYTAKYLQSSLHKRIMVIRNENSTHHHSMSTKLANIESLNIDMIDRLPTPFGLVRSGVAPDHPEVKNVENDFASLFSNQIEVNQENKSGPGFQSSITFRGNINVGKDVSLSELKSLYDIVILAYGCESDRKLGIQGESELRGVISAREFVWYYNGHPDHVGLGNVLQDVLSPNKPKKNVVVIGQGNVALDCARILAKGGENMVDTDIASHAIPVLENGVNRVTVIGRRGHIQGAFTIKELRELVKLEEEGYGASFEIREEEIDDGLTPTSLKELNGPRGRAKQRIDKLLRDASQQCTSKDVEKSVIIRFFLQPVAFLPHPKYPERLGSVRFERTRLEGDELGNQRAVPTGIFEVFPADMALVSVGYRGIPLPDFNEEMFDTTRGIIKNTHGRVCGSDALYVSGWLKRGPSGIIGSNIGDAKNTVSTIIADLDSEEILNSEGATQSKGRNGLDVLMNQRNIHIVDWNHYQIIDAVEKDPLRRRTRNQPREKITDISEMLRLKHTK